MRVADIHVRIISKKAFIATKKKVDYIYSMRFLGIDFGSKRVGIALSDPSGEFALPKVVLENNKSLLKNVIEIIRNNEVSTVVIGESKNFKGEEIRFYCLHIVLINFSEVSASW